MQKAELRREMLQKRAHYGAAAIQEYSSRIAALFFTFSLQQVQTVHVFLPIQRKQEVDTWLIIRKLQTDFPHIRIAVSVSDTEKFILNHYWLKPDTELVENKWGIPEPAGAVDIPVGEIDLVMVPLLAFDSRGHRVGYGKGFYDRFLLSCRPDTLKIGLSLEDAIHQIADVHEGDIELDYAITPDRIYAFT